MTFTGYVYKITGACGLVYIGSTVDMVHRKHIHNSTTNNCSSNLLKKPLQFDIIDTREYKLMKTLQLIEQFYLDNTNTINQKRAYTNRQSFNFKQKRKQYKIQYKLDNDEFIKKNDKIYRDNNKEKIREKDRIYYNKNREKRLEQNKVEIMCECGCLIRKVTKSRHKKSKKHLKLMNLL